MKLFEFCAVQVLLGSPAGRELVALGGACCRVGRRRTLFTRGPEHPHAGVGTMGLRPYRVRTQTPWRLRWARLFPGALSCARPHSAVAALV